MEGEDSGEGWEVAENFGGVLRGEGDGVLEVEGRGHRRIVSSGGERPIPGRKFGAG
jgi:hypothetical protein